MRKRIMFQPQRLMILKAQKRFLALLIISWMLITTSGCAPIVQEVKSSLGLEPEKELEMALTRTPSQWQDATKLAAEVDPKVMEGQSINKDTALNQRLQKMVDRLRAVSHAPGVPFKVKIIESNQINAFNTGGELLYVYTGLINFVESDDELAGILAHEMAHGIASHLQRERKSMFLPSLGAALTSLALQNKSADQIIGLTNQAISSGYSRRHEREADILAVIYTYRAGYNPLSFDDFFYRISQKANQVKEEKEDKLRQVYAHYKQTSNLLEKEKQSQVISHQRYRKNPGSGEAKQQLQESQKRLEKVQQEHDQQYFQYKEASQSYAQAISQLFPFFQSHPSDPERIDMTTKTFEYLKGERSLKQTPEQVQYVMDVVEKIAKKSGK